MLFIKIKKWLFFTNEIRKKRKLINIIECDKLYYEKGHNINKIDLVINYAKRNVRSARSDILGEIEGEDEVDGTIH